MFAAIAAGSFGSSFGSQYRIAKATAGQGRRHYQMLRVSRKPVKKSRQVVKLIKMKKIVLLTLTLAFSFFSMQHAFCQDAEFVIPKNEEVTIEGKDGIIITASDVYSMNSKLKRKITIYDSKTKTMIGEAFIKVESSKSSDNIYYILQNDPAGFSGFISIEVDDQVAYVQNIVNGNPVKGDQVASKQSFQGGPGPVYNPNLRCTFRNIHDCVAYNIEKLNWFQFGVCLVSAPACYAKHWADCGWEVCHNHMQYTNPN